jgi:hypothetical protein
MSPQLTALKTTVFDKAGLPMTHYHAEPESQEYGACRFELDGKRIIYRNAKQTPKKIGQFVTFWKRDKNGPIAPFDQDDPFDFFMVNVDRGERLGLFIIPKAEAVNRGIVSTFEKEGKLAFRIYPAWDKPTSAQAIRSQKWQLGFFFEVGVGNVEVIHKLLR